MRKSYGFALALALLACAVTQTARAQDAAYVVSYFETMPATQNEAAALARAFADASRKDEGNLRFEVMQRIGPSYHFSIVEVCGRMRRRRPHMPQPRIPNSSVKNCSRCCAARTTNARTPALQWARCR